MDTEANTIPERAAPAVAIQGEIGAFSYSAALKLIGAGADIRPYETFTEVFTALLSKETDFAVIPIENTLYGSVHENYDHLVKYEVAIRGETTLRICHNLIARPGTSLADIRRAFSHPVALDQCRLFFQQHPDIKPSPFYDTAGSVKMLMSELLPGAAAIASEGAASHFGGEVLLRGIEDNQGNFTRFFLLSKQDRSSTLPVQNLGPWKTSVVFATSNSPGALFKALACFALRELSLSKLESRPIRERPWEYLFYVDLAGSVNDTAVGNALSNLEELTTYLKVLGSYSPTP